MMFLSVKQDAEMKKLGDEEYTVYKEELTRTNNDLLEAILENTGRESCREIVLEITTGVGGQESMLFARDLFDMYLGYLEYLGFSHEIIQEDSIAGTKGLRHACIAITGDRAMEIFRHEGGVHRVQRVPATEKSGRIHTSTVSVAVLPQPSEIEVNLKDKDLRIETKNASGAGGQHVNTTDSAVRITHLPTGIVVESQSDRSQMKNRINAMLRLRMKIYDMQMNEQRTTSGEMRKKQMGLGTRNEKVRTYNFNQDRITDHRIADGTTHNLKDFLEGGEDLGDLQRKLQRRMQIKMFREAIEKIVK